MRVVLAGYGVEGRASYDYWSRLGAEVAIADERAIEDAPTGVRLISGNQAFSNLSEFDLIIRSPGIRLEKLPYKDKVSSATNEFFSKCVAPIIGVTGTKGKGTTSSLIASILKTAGRKVHLVGNIGVSALEILPIIQPGDIVVYELSSFQLWDIKKSPHVAVVLMIEPDHLDVHRDYEDYINAKSNIVRYQNLNDVVIYNPKNQQSVGIAELSHGKQLGYGSKDLGGVYIDVNKFFVQDKEICSIDELKLVGRHNLDNACAAITACYQLIPDLGGDTVASGLGSFTGLDHRLKFVDERGGVKYYDDSIATTPGSAIAAINSFVEPKVIILGGSDKGASYEEIVLAAKDSNTRVVAIGQTGQKIFELCRQHGVSVEHESGGMTDVVKRVSLIAKAGDVVILSPASASFDQYKNYADRGQQFSDAVRELADKKL